LLEIRKERKKERNRTKGERNIGKKWERTREHDNSETSKPKKERKLMVKKNRNLWIMTKAQRIIPNNRGEKQEKRRRIKLLRKLTE